MANTFVFDDDEPQPDAGAPAPEPTEPPEQPEGGEGEGNNRTFLIAAIILGGIVLLSLICMAVLAVFWLPSQNAMRAATQAANIEASTQQAAFAGQQTQEAAATDILPPTEMPTLAPTETPVVVFATSTASVAPTGDPATATVQALQTQLAAAQVAASQTAEALGTPGAGAAGKTAGTPGKTTGTPGKTTGTPGATSQLAKTGFADEVGLPGLFILSIILVAVILLARRLRQAPLAH